MIFYIKFTIFTSSDKQIYKYLWKYSDSVKISEFFLIILCQSVSPFPFLYMEKDVENLPPLHHHPHIASRLANNTHNNNILSCKVTN